MSRWRLIWRRAFAWLMLGVAIVRRQLGRLIPGRSAHGVEQFLAHYAGEGMAPMTADEEALLRAFGACIHCGLCEAVCPLPIDRLLSYTRATQLSVEAAEAWAGAACAEGCDACARVCPTGVPVAAVPAFVAGRAAAQLAVSPASTPASPGSAVSAPEP